MEAVLLYPRDDQNQRLIEQEQLINDKNKSIKIQQQTINDLKKTIKRELKGQSDGKGQLDVGIRASASSIERIRSSPALSEVDRLVLALSTY